jgi:glycosyltransferase involved in cell wall biosynthesis
VTAAPSESSLRVTFISWRDLAHPQAGGSEVLIDRLAEGLLERGHDVTLMCGGPVGHRPYKVLDLGGEFSQYARAPVTYHRRVRRSDVIVDVQNGVPFFSPLWARSPVVCLVHHVHGPQWRLRFNRGVAEVGWALERWAMPLAYRRRPFIAMSPSTAESLDSIGVAAASVSVMINGVEMPPGGDVDRYAEPMFVALGRLVPHKRVELLLRAWERVRPVTGGRLVIAGGGPELDRLRALAGLHAEVLGPISEAEKAELLGKAWLLVHGAMHEGWGIVVMEAAAHGTPTLATSKASVRDAVVRDVTGVLVDDEDGLVRQWIALAADPERRSELGDAARARALDFGWAKTVDRFEGLLRSAVDAAPRAESLA